MFKGNDVLKARVGDLMFEVCTLQAENANLKEKLVELARALPPDQFKEISERIGLEITIAEPVLTPPPTPPE